MSVPGFVSATWFGDELCVSLYTDKSKACLVMIPGTAAELASVIGAALKIKNPGCGARGENQSTETESISMSRLARDTDTQQGGV